MQVCNLNSNFVVKNMATVDYYKMRRKRKYCLMTF